MFYYASTETDFSASKSGLNFVGSQIAACTIFLPCRAKEALSKAHFYTTTVSCLLLYPHNYKARVCRGQLWANTTLIQKRFQYTAYTSSFVRQVLALLWIHQVLFILMQQRLQIFKRKRGRTRRVSYLLAVEKDVYLKLSESYIASPRNV